MEVAALLNELLLAEYASIAPRLIESTTFVPPRWARADMIVRRMAAASRENCAVLTELILDSGGIPAPRRSSAHTADIHFLDLGCMLPRLYEDQRKLVDRYAQAVPLLAGHPEAARLAGRILESHRRDLHALEEVMAQTAPKAA